MISPDITKKLHTQLNREFQASYLYLSMAAWLEGESWNGFAAWMRRQADEERAHAMKVFEYLLDQEAEVKLLQMTEPPSQFGSVVDIFEKTLKAEQAVTKSYQELMGAVRTEGDYATEILTQWFITEQVEEEATVGNILDRLKRVADSQESLLILDKEVGEAGPAH